MVALFWITVGIGGVWVVVFALSIAEWLQAPRIKPRARGEDEEFPRVSIVVPARNEEKNIGACLKSLMAQDHGDLEFIVIDDASTDKTAEIVRELAAQDDRVRLVQASDPPPGWTGKCNAMHQGFVQGEPTGEWLLFTDADTQHHPSSISSSLRLALEKGVDFLTLLPNLGAMSFWERLMQPTMFALIALFNKHKRINDPDCEEAFANGQYMLVKKDAYVGSGGHEAVCGKILDDSELARSVVGCGHRMYVAMGQALFTTRMYMSLAELIEGWTKNFYMILESRIAKVLLATFLVVLLSMWPAVIGYLSVAGMLFDMAFWPQSWLWVGLSIYLMVLAFQTVLRALNDWYPTYAILAWLANLVAVYILLRSAWYHVRGRGVTWKGRDVIESKD
jgi:glycosyltransferase involved in cell wall biosynthesis